MVAILAAQIAGVDMNIQFFIMLVMVVAISSFGIAGVGGGATFAAISVLSIMGLDVTVAAILIGIEPLIDMARTALNISDSMLAGVITAKKNKTLKQDVYDK
jgi:L-cystine uptake protein TcyP (sodium:dicarboxylate symporter family)